MKKISYYLQDMEKISSLLNEITSTGIQNARAISMIADIIDNCNFGIEEIIETENNEPEKNEDV